MSLHLPSKINYVNLMGLWFLFTRGWQIRGMCWGRTVSLSTFMWHCYREGAAPKIYPSKTTPAWWTTMRQDRGHPGLCWVGVWNYDAQENWWISSSWRRYCRTGCRRMWLSCRWCAFLVLCLFCKRCFGPVWGTLHQISAATAPPQTRINN